jgi:hypothetical protein
VSCESQSNKIASLVGQVSTGISQLSSKQAFYAGVSVGVSGAGLSAILVANRQRIASFFQRRGQAQPRQAISIGPGTPVRPKPKPIPALGTAGTSTQTKPKPMPGLAKTTSKQKPKPIPTLSNPASTTIDTRLKATSVAVKTADGQSTKTEGYDVVRADDSRTGLAITPYVGQQGNGESKPGGWGITHVGTGALIDGPYDSVDQAQGLANQLASLRWTGTAVPKADVTQARQVIKRYRQSLADGE